MVEPCHVGPDALGRLLVVPAGAGGVVGEAGTETAAAGEADAEVGELLAPAARVAAQFRRGQAEAVVPFGRAARERGRGLSRPPSAKNPVTAAASGSSRSGTAAPNGAFQNASPAGTADTPT